METMMSNRAVMNDLGHRKSGRRRMKGGKVESGMFGSTKTTWQQLAVSSGVTKLCRHLEAHESWRKVDWGLGGRRTRERKENHVDSAQKEKPNFRRASESSNKWKERRIQGLALRQALPYKKRRGRRGNGPHGRNEEKRGSCAAKFWGRATFLQRFAMICRSRDTDDLNLEKDLEDIHSQWSGREWWRQDEKTMGTGRRWRTKITAAMNLNQRLNA